ncbi:MAG: zinc metallopeptidase [Lachnospiraceae bacterium]|nr:zinc metallopeptidase [Lachnospiraceae bacterium]
MSYGVNHFYGYGMGGFGFLFDPTMILVWVGLILSLLAQAKVKSTFAKYERVRSVSGMTGAQAAERILHSAGIYDVSIARVQGSLTDHYDPRSKTLRLSDSTYGSSSVAAVGVAAHECGHAIQHQQHYAPLGLRSALVPAANLGSTLAWPIFLVGLIASLPFLTTAGIVLFSLAVLFQLITLPVEINASRRAVQLVESTGVLGSSESSGVRKVLTAAALTYVASLAASILQLLRLVILAGGRNRD